MTKAEAAPGRQPAQLLDAERGGEFTSFVDTSL